MALTGSLLEFWQAWYGRSPERRVTPWGVVITDARYPSLYDANHAAVFRHEVDADDILSELTPDLERADAAFQHVQFWDPPDPCPALEQIAQASDERNWDVEMVYEGPPSPAGRHTDIDVREADPADPDVLAVYEPTQQMYGETFSDDVVDQLNRRFREVMIPAGIRMFAAVTDGEIAGFVNVLPLEGVAYLDAVVTLPHFRQRGVASTAVTAVVDRMLAEGLDVVHLLAEEGGAPQRLYERVGFRVHARVGTATRRRSTAEG